MKPVSSTIRTFRHCQGRINFLSRFTLVAVLIVAILLPPPQLAEQVKIDGRCKDRCDENRPKGHKQSFKFSCLSYDKDEEREACRKDCEVCPKEVCDETLSVSNTSANAWHCPETELTGWCRNTCNENRPKGTREKYILNCDQIKNDDDRDLCEGNCGAKCPTFVCDRDKKAMHCPDEKFDGACKAQCDKARKANPGSTNWLKAFTFSCSEEYRSSPDDETTCRQKCWDCPNWVCDSSDRNTYHCPAAEITGDCQQFCDSKREERSVGTRDYELSCETKYSPSEWEFFCKEKCSRCTNSDGHNYICSPDNPKVFYCPQKEPDNFPPTAQRSYKGTCKERCEASRGGGYNPFEIHCGSRYKTEEEIEICKQDCEKCSRDVCDRIYPTTTVWRCPGIKEKMDEAAARKKKEWQRQEEQKKSLYNEKDNAVFGFSIAYIIMIGSTLGFWAYKRRKYGKMNNPINTAMQQQSVALMIQQQQQQQQSSTLMIQQQQQQNPFAPNPATTQ